MKALIGIILAVVVSAQEQARVANGKLAKHGYVPSYVYMKIETGLSTKYCGGVLNPSRTEVVTACTCVATTTTGGTVTLTATHIRFAFGQTNSFRHDRLDYTIYTGTFNLVDTGSGITPTTVPNNNLCVIVLDRAVRSSLLKSVSGATFDTLATRNAYVGKSLIVCGFGGDGDGDILDHEKLLCTTLSVVSNDQCDTAIGFPPSLNPSPLLSYICTKGDSSVCADIGAGVYLPTTSSTGSSSSLLITKRHLTTAVGVVSFCLGGFIFVTQLGNYPNFLGNPSDPTP